MESRSAVSGTPHANPPERAGAGEVARAEALVARALNALAAARREQARCVEVAELAAAELDRSARIRKGIMDVWAELEAGVSVVAGLERQLGYSPEHMVVLLKGLVEQAPLDRELKRVVRSDVVEWGVSAYYAA